ncbi:MAG: hypothetical protein JST51_01480 [Armatimonadetes bacterium]|nr:hypothetical protein [Armatimonadota bacterium]
MASHYTGDISLFTLNGSSVIDTFDGVTLTVTEEQKDVSSLRAAGENMAGTKLEGMIEVDLRTQAGVAGTVSHLDAASLALGSLSFDCFRTTSFNIAYNTADEPCVGAVYRRKLNTKLKITTKVEVTADDDIASSILSAFASSASWSARNATYDLAFNSINYTLPMRMSSAQLVGERDGLQVVSVDLASKSPDTGAFPTAPTGTIGLLQKSLNAFKDPIAFAFQSIASTIGVAVSGNVMFDSVSFEISDEAIVPIKYRFRNYGDWTIAAGT